MSSFFSFSAPSITGELVDFSRFRNRVVLVVNVASKCGYTPQYQGLEELYKKDQAQGFTVLGFPCNQFGSQEPGDADEILSFCSNTYGVSVPIFKKIDVNGADTDP